jgi:hypothetical protein
VDITASGSEQFEIVQGSQTPLDLSVSGLVGVTPIAESVGTGEFDINAPVADGSTTRVYPVVVPAGTVAARFSLDSDDDTADLDLYVYKAGVFVDLSASGAADEEVTLRAPAAGTYDVYVNGFTTPGGSTSYLLSNFVLDSTDRGNLDVAPDPVPAPATLGQPSTVTATWTGLDTTQRYFGVISYTGSDVITYFAAD